MTLNKPNPSEQDPPSHETREREFYRDERDMLVEILPDEVVEEMQRLLTYEPGPDDPVVAALVKTLQQSDEEI